MFLFHEKLIFLMILPGSGLGLLPFAISPVVPTGSINCEPGIIFNNVFSFLNNSVSTAWYTRIAVITIKCYHAVTGAGPDTERCWSSVGLPDSVFLKPG